MSNISPQFASFNSGIWKTLENRVRKLSAKGTTHVVTGPIFRDNIKTIGDNKVTVPGYYYKVIYQPKNNIMLAFILPHLKKLKDKYLPHYAVLPSEVQNQTGIDFFSQLPDALQTKLENRINTDVIQKYFINATQARGTKTKIESKQCKGITVSGNRCSRKTRTDNYCWKHD